MKRRRFLQLAASAAAGVVVQHSSASPAGRVFHSPADVLSLAVGVRAPAAFDTSGAGLSGTAAPSTARRDGSATLPRHAGASAMTKFKAVAELMFVSGMERSTRHPDQMLEMLLEKSADGSYGWTIDGRSYPAKEPPLLQRGRRYRLRMMNATGEIHSVSLRHHSFEITRIRQVPVSGIFKDTLPLERYDVVEADILMRRSGPLLLRYANS
jgi:hypothetical protein